MTRMLKHFWLVIFFLVVFAPSDSFVCTCVNPYGSCNSQWTTGDTVFVGTVTAIEPIRTDTHSYGLGKNIRFSVTETFRGEATVGREMVIHTGESSSDCGYHFIEGTSYLVYAFKEQNRLMTSICTSTGPQIMVEGLLKQLRSVRERRRPAILFGTVAVGSPAVREEDLKEFKPLAGRRVRAIGSTNKDYSTETDRHGVYTFPSLPADTYRLEIDLPPGLSQWPQSVGELLTLRLRPEDSLTGCRADLFARPDGQISGQVVDEAARPLDGFVTIGPASAQVSEAYPTRGGIQSYTTQNGKFILKLLPPGRYVLVFYPKRGGEINFRHKYTSNVVDLGFGQHIVNFTLKCPRPTAKVKTLSRRGVMRVEGGLNL